MPLPLGLDVRVGHQFVPFTVGNCCKSCYIFELDGGHSLQRSRAGFGIISKGQFSLGMRCLDAQLLGKACVAVTPVVLGFTGC